MTCIPGLCTIIPDLFFGAPEGKGIRSLQRLATGKACPQRTVVCAKDDLPLHAAPFWLEACEAVRPSASELYLPSVSVRCGVQMDVLTYTATDTACRHWRRSQNEERPKWRAAHRGRKRRSRLLGARSSPSSVHPHFHRVWTPL